MKFSGGYIHVHEMTSRRGAQIVLTATACAILIFFEIVREDSLDLLLSDTAALCEVEAVLILFLFLAISLRDIVRTSESLVD